MQAISGTAMLAELENNLDDISKVDDLVYDLALLTAMDAHAINPSDYAASREAALDASAEANAQLLVRAIFSLPREMVDEVGAVALLPSKISRLPRELPVPAAKEPTKWEQFAKQKGIAKKGKRDRMVFDAGADEGKGDWAPRYGYKRARGDETAPLVYELKKGDDLKTDHLERLSNEKKFKVTTNQLNRVQNAERLLSAKNAKKGLRLATGSGLDGGEVQLKRGKKAKRAALQEARAYAQEIAGSSRRAPAGIPSIPIAEGRADVISGASKQPKMRPSDSLATKVAQVSHTQVLTASMGKVSKGHEGCGFSVLQLTPPQFDRVSKGEPIRRGVDSLKRKRLPNEAIPSERSRDANILSSVLKGVPAQDSIYAPVPSASLQGRGKPGIRTQAPKKKPKGVFGVPRPNGKPKPSGPPASRFAKGKGGKGGKGKK
jgi:hypothetical protein